MQRTCDCKNTCGRKSGKRRGCSCKDACRSCSSSCICGSVSRPCKNNKTSAIGVLNITRGPPPPSAFSRHHQAVREAAEEIRAFVGNLSVEDKEKLLVNLLSNGRGSLDFAKNLVDADENDPEPSVNEEQPDWCVCGICRPMQTPDENKCCGKRTCVTSYELFRNICLDREVLTLAIRARCDIRADEPHYEMNSFRKAAYRQYILWKYGKLGKGNRRVCPACVVRVVRSIYPAPDGHYMGFRAR